MAEMQEAKWIEVYKNGDLYSRPVKFFVRRKENFDSLLNMLTYRLKPSFGAVRSLYTPVNGTKVQSLDELEPNKKYVAAGTEKFRQLSYASILCRPIRNRPRNFFLEGSFGGWERTIYADFLEKIQSCVDNGSIQPVLHSRIKVASRYKKAVENSDALTIFVYRNGNDLSPPHVVALNKKDMRSWELMLQRISERVLPSPNGFVRKLYTLDGKLLTNFGEVLNGFSYVAVVGRESFRRIAYGMLAPPQSRRFNTWKHTESVTRVATEQDCKLEENNTGVINWNRPRSPEKSGRMHRALLNEREKQKGIFTVKDQNSLSKGNVKEVDYDQDGIGVFRSKNRGYQADEIKDTRETAVEVPLDARPAEEVKAEEIQTSPIRRRRKEYQENIVDDEMGTMSAAEPSVEVDVDEAGNVIRVATVTSNPCLPSSPVNIPQTKPGGLTWRSVRSTPLPLEFPPSTENNSQGSSLDKQAKYMPGAWNTDIKKLKRRLLTKLTATDEEKGNVADENSNRLHTSAEFYVKQNNVLVPDSYEGSGSTNQESANVRPQKMEERFTSVKNDRLFRVGDSLQSVAGVKNDRRYLKKVVCGQNVTKNWFPSSAQDGNVAIPTVRDEYATAREEVPVHHQMQITPRPPSSNMYETAREIPFFDHVATVDGAGVKQNEQSIHSSKRSPFEGMIGSAHRDGNTERMVADLDVSAVENSDEAPSDLDTPSSARQTPRNVQDKFPQLTSDSLKRSLDTLTALAETEKRHYTPFHRSAHSCNYAGSEMSSSTTTDSPSDYSPSSLASPIKTFRTISPLKPVESERRPHLDLPSPMAQLRDGIAQMDLGDDGVKLVQCNGLQEALSPVSRNVNGNSSPVIQSPGSKTNGTLKIKVDLKARCYSVCKVPGRIESPNNSPVHREGSFVRNCTPADLDNTDKSLSASNKDDMNEAKLS